MAVTAFGRALVARRLPDHDCWADDGEWLVPASEDATPAFRLPPGAHFFRGIASGRGARYGVVAEIAEGVDPAAIAPAMGGDARRAEAFLLRLAREAPGTVMGISWKRTYGTPLKRRPHLAVHRARLGRPLPDPRHSL